MKMRSGKYHCTNAQDRETRSQVNLTVVASNIDATPQRNTTVTVVINVQDANDNPPVFSPAQYNVNISENNTSPDLVLTVTAMDGDEPMVYK